MTANYRRLLGVSLVAAVSLTGCAEHGVDARGSGSIAIQVILPTLSPSEAVEGAQAAPAQPVDALNHLDSAIAIISGPTNKTQKLAGPSPGFSGTITELNVGSYSVVVTGYDQNAVHYVARTTGVTVASNVTTAATPTFATMLVAGLTATGVSGAQISLAWRDSATSEDGFRIERCSGASCSNFAEVGTVAANATTFPNTGLTPGTSYSYRVRAYVGTTMGNYSGTATAVATAPTISLSSGTATFTSSAGGASPSPQTINVTSGNGAALSGLAVGTIVYGGGASGWLAANLSSTTAPSTLTLTATTGSLIAGSYTATVPVTSGVASNSPQNVSVTFNVAAAGPDLVVTAFSIAGTPAPAAAGDPLSVTMIRQNQGAVTAGASRYGFYFSTDATVTTGDVISPLTVNLVPLAGNSGATLANVLIFVPASLAPGTYFVAAIIDDQGAVTETNENNNVSPTASITVRQSLLTNGSFTAGGTGWIGVGTNGYAPTTGTDQFSAPGWLMLATDANGVGVNNVSGAAYQDITIPAGATTPTLTFWYNITSAEVLGTPYDFLVVTVRNTSNTILATVATLSDEDQVPAAGYPNYTQRTFGLTPYLGQTIRIYFAYSTDASAPTVFRLDNVNVTRQ